MFHLATWPIAGDRTKFSLFLRTYMKLSGYIDAQALDGSTRWTLPAIGTQRYLKMRDIPIEIPQRKTILTGREYRNTLQ